MNAAVRTALQDAERIFAAINRDEDPINTCIHELEQNVCLHCSQCSHPIYLGQTSLAVPDPIDPDLLHLPPCVEKELVIQAVDLFGCLNTTQIRARKKKVILTACLLYVCGTEKAQYFYKNFHQYRTTTREMLYGISMVEKLMPPSQRHHSIDLKFHEMMLGLIDRGQLAHMELIAGLHPMLHCCYNRLRAKSVLDACLYLANPCGKQPSATALVRESLFMHTLPSLFIDLFRRQPVGVHSRQLTHIEGEGVVIILHNGLLEIRSREGALFDHRRATWGAWNRLFTGKFYHPNGFTYSAQISVKELMDNYQPNFSELLINKIKA